MLLDEAEQVFRAAFLLALDHRDDRQRQAAGDGLERTTRLDEGHHLAFVVAGAARHDDLAAVRQRRDARRERRRLPQVERIDRLHVVVAVEQNARSLAVACAPPLPTTIGWPAVGRTLVSKPMPVEILGHEVGGRLALILVGRIGRDRLDLQELEQPCETVVELGVDLVEDGGKRL